MRRLAIVPLDLAEANALVGRMHRHHRPVVGHKFSIGVIDESNEVVGAVIVGRPVSRHLDDGWTLEVLRCVTDGTSNACSALYGAAWRTARSMGYRKCITYVLKSEGGGSVKAAGWKCIGEAGGGSWNVPSRPRVDKHPTELKLRFEIGEPPK